MEKCEIFHALPALLLGVGRFGDDHLLLRHRERSVSAGLLHEHLIAAGMLLEDPNVFEVDPAVGMDDRRNCHEPLKSGQSCSESVC